VVKIYQIINWVVVQFFDLQNIVLAIIAAISASCASWFSIDQQHYSIFKMGVKIPRAKSRVQNKFTERQSSFHTFN
jgi:hypothetical protein